MYRKRIDDEQIRNKCDAYDYVHGRCTMYANCNMWSYRIQICNFKMKQRCNKGSRWNMCLARLEKPPNPRLQTRQLVLITVLSLLPSTVWNGCCKTLEEYMSMVSCIECRSHLPQLFHQYCVLVTNKSVNWILCRDVEEVQRHNLAWKEGTKVWNTKHCFIDIRETPAGLSGRAITPALRMSVSSSMFRE